MPDTLPSRWRSRPAAATYVASDVDPDYLFLPQEPLEPGEGLAEHYLEVGTETLPPTRTRTRSESGAPPEWFRGAHGEALRSKRRPPPVRAPRPWTGIRRSPREEPEDLAMDLQDDGDDGSADTSELSDPLMISSADVLATRLGFSDGVQGCWSLESYEFRQAALELLRLAKSADLDPFDVISHFTNLLTAAGHSGQDVAAVVSSLRFHTTRTMYEEHSGSADSLKMLLDVCEDVRLMVSRTEGIANSFLLIANRGQCTEGIANSGIARAGAYEDLCRTIESAEGVPKGFQNVQEEAMNSLQEFSSCLKEFAKLLQAGQRYDQFAATILKDQERQEFDMKKSADAVEKASEAYSRKHEEWKDRLWDKYMVFRAAHRRVNEEVSRLRTAYSEKDSEARKNEEVMDEWNKRLHALQDKRNTALTRSALSKTKRSQETESKLKMDIKSLEVKEAQIADEMQKQDALAQSYLQKIQEVLINVIANSMTGELARKANEARERREAEAMRVEDDEGRLLQLNEKLELKKLKDATEVLKAELECKQERHADLKQRAEMSNVEKLDARARMCSVEKWLQTHGQHWSVDHDTGKLVSQPPLSMPLAVLQTYRAFIARRLRSRQRRGASSRVGPIEVAESPGGKQPLPEDLVWDRRRAISGASENPRFQQCLASSFSAPSLAYSPTLPLKRLLRLPPATTSNLLVALEAEAEREEDAPSPSFKGRNVKGGLRDVLGLGGKAALAAKAFADKQGEPKKPMPRFADWSKFRKRWSGLWTDVQGLCNHDNADGAGVSAVRRPWASESLVPLQTIILDGARYLDGLEKLEAALVLAKRLQLKHRREQLQASVDSDEYQQDFEIQWEYLAGCTKGHEERQRALASVVAILVALDGRSARVETELENLGDETEDIAFGTRLLPNEKGPKVEALTLQLQRRMNAARLHAMVVGAETRAIQAEVYALFDSGGPVAALESEMLCKEEFLQRPREIAERVRSDLSKHRSELKAQVDTLEAAKLMRQQAAERDRIERNKKAQEAAQEAAKLKLPIAIEREPQEDKAQKAGKKVGTRFNSNASVSDHESDAGEDASHGQASDEDSDAEAVDLVQSAPVPEVRVSSSGEAEVRERVRPVPLAMQDCGDAGHSSLVVPPARDSTSNSGARASLVNKRASARWSIRHTEKASLTPQAIGAIREGLQLDDPHVLAPVVADAESWAAEQHLYGPGRKSGIQKLQTLADISARMEKDHREKPETPIGKVAIVSPTFDPLKPPSGQLGIALPGEDSPMRRNSESPSRRQGMSSPRKKGSKDSPLRRGSDWAAPSPSSPRHEAAAGLGILTTLITAMRSEPTSKKQIGRTLSREILAELEPVQKSLSGSNVLSRPPSALARQQVSMDEVQFSDWAATASAADAIGSRAESEESDGTDGEEEPQQDAGLELGQPLTASTPPEYRKHSHVAELHSHVVESSGGERKRSLYRSHLESLQGMWEMDTNLQSLHVGHQVKAPEEERRIAKQKESSVEKLSEETNPETNEGLTAALNRDEHFEQPQGWKQISRRHESRRNSASYAEAKTGGAETRTQQQEPTPCRAQSRFAPGIKPVPSAQVGFVQGFYPGPVFVEPNYSPATDIFDDLDACAVEARGGNFEVDVPFDELDFRPETPAWMFDMVERVVQLTPAFPDEGCRFDDETPPPPPLDKVQPDASRPESAEARASRHRWLPLSGLDAQRASWQAMPQSLVQRLRDDVARNSALAEDASDAACGGKGMAPRASSRPASSSATTRVASPLPPRPNNAGTEGTEFLAYSPLESNLPSDARNFQSPVDARDIVCGGRELPWSSWGPPRVGTSASSRPGSSARSRGATPQLSRPLTAKRDVVEPRASTPLEARPPSSARNRPVSGASEPRASTPLEARPPSSARTRPVSGASSRTRPGTAISKVSGRSGERKQDAGDEALALPVATSEATSTSAHKLSVLSRGFCDQMKKGMAVCSARQRPDIPDGRPPPAVRGPWPSRSGPLGRAAAARPR